MLKLDLEDLTESLDQAELGVEGGLDVVTVVVLGSDHVRKGGGMRRKGDGELSEHTR